MEIVFNKGIPGFDELRAFNIKALEGNDSFKLLESSEDPNISFVIVNPFHIYEEYEITLDGETIRELSLEKPEEALIFNIVTLGGTLESSTVNLKAPIVINVSNNWAKQYILSSETYETKHPLIRRENNVSNY